MPYTASTSPSVDWKEAAAGVLTLNADNPLSELAKLLDAWTSASQQTGEHPPAIEELAEGGVDLDHPGHAIIAHVDPSTSRPQTTSFKLLKGGAHHLRDGGLVGYIGQRLDEILHPAHAARVEAIYRDAVKTNTPHSWRCMNLARNAPALRYSRTIVPIRDTAGDGRCLFGIWIWTDLNQVRLPSVGEVLRNAFAP